MGLIKTETFLKVLDNLSLFNNEFPVFSYDDYNFVGYWLREKFSNSLSSAMSEINKVQEHVSSSNKIIKKEDYIKIQNAMNSIIETFFISSGISTNVNRSDLINLNSLSLIKYNDVERLLNVSKKILDDIKKNSNFNTFYQRK